MIGQDLHSLRRVDESELLATLPTSLMRDKQPGAVSTVKPPDPSSSKVMWYGFYFWGFWMTKHPDQEKQFLDGLKRLYGERVDADVAVWDQRDEQYGKVENSFGILYPPAFVITKPWFGNKPFCIEEDWKQFIPLADRHTLPIHIVLQGGPHFQDIDSLLGGIETIGILFSKEDEGDIKKALQEQKLKSLADKIHDYSEQIVLYLNQIVHDIQIEVSAGAFKAAFTLNNGGVTAK